MKAMALNFSITVHSNLGSAETTLWVGKCSFPSKTPKVD
jgi:hypothetical protein